MLKTEPDVMERTGRKGKLDLVDKDGNSKFYFLFPISSSTMVPCFFPCWLDLQVQFCITAIRYLMEEETDTRKIIQHSQMLIDFWGDQ